MYSMSRVARRIYVDDAAGVFRQDIDLPKSPATAIHYDWEASRQIAAAGGIPPPPKVDPQRQSLLRDIMRMAEAKETKKLLDLRIPSYNTHVRSLGKYRDLCIIAILRASEAEAVPLADNGVTG
jgi:hypothetical protein